MTSAFHPLSCPALLGLAKAYDSGRLKFPCTEGSVMAYVPSSLAPAICDELNQLHSKGMTSSLMARTLL